MHFSFTANCSLLRAASLLLVFGTLALGQSEPVHATTTVGSIPGSHQVSPSGAFTYSIPIAVPPGTAGIEPKLSLAYNSQGGNGLLGMGWSLAGLSVIHRCPKTVAQDGVLGGINYDANDRYCLDGQRLVAVSGAYGADATEYRTESESYSRIVSYGSQGSGPAWWKVWTKSGQVLEYGNTADSRIEAQGKTEVMLWSLNKLSDTIGNYLTVSYIEDTPNGQYYPDRIDYTGNTTAGKSPTNSVRFIYETRPDITPLYQAGSLSKTTVRLTNVQTYAGNIAAKDYQLTYGQSTETERSNLLSLTECSVDGICLIPTKLNWPDRQSVLFTELTESLFVAGDTSTISNQFSIGDFNGDGFADPAITVGNTLLAFGTIAGTLDSNIVQGPSSSYPGLVVGDLNGDGLSDVLRWQPSGSVLCLSVYTATRQGMLLDPGNLPYLWSSACGDLPENLIGAPYLRDVNGDGRADVIWYSAHPPAYRGRTQAVISVALAQEGGRFQVCSGKCARVILPVQTTTCLSGDCAQNERFDMAELNGDGKTDAVRYDAKSGNLYSWISTGTGAFGGNIATYFVAGGTLGDRWFMLADVNGDGLGDAVLFVPSSGVLTLAFALGNGRFSNPIANSFIAGGSPGTRWFQMVDVNSDGRADAVEYDPVSGNIYAALSRGDGAFSAPLTVPFPIGGSPQDRWFLMADVNGDGRPDPVLHVPGSNKVQILPSLREAIDVVGSITAGLGATTTVAYKSLTDESVYTKDATAVYPYIDVQAPLYVVSSVSTSDGIGGNHVTEYSYVGAKSHQTGGGFLGFHQVTVHDRQAHIRSVTTYRQDYPYQGQPLSTQKLTDSGVLLGQSLITYTDQLLNPALSPTWHQSWPTHTVESSYELNGGAPISTVTTDTQYDGWGNPTSIVVNSGEDYSKTTTNTYDNITDANRWFLGRLRRSTVNSVTP